MAKKKKFTAKRKTGTTAKPATNPVRRDTAKKAKRPRRNPFGASMRASASGLLGELASKDGLMLLGGALVAPTVVDYAFDAVLPAGSSYRDGWTGIAIRAGIAAIAVVALDKLKQRKLATGFAISSGASLLNRAITLYRVKGAAPTAPGALQDAMVENPAYRNAVLSGGYNHLNGYGTLSEIGMAGYGEPVSAIASDGFLN